MNHELIHRLIQDEASGRFSRRQILQRAAALGLSAPAVATLFAGTIPVRAMAQDADNPLGVDPVSWPVFPHERSRWYMMVSTGCPVRPSGVLDGNAV